MHTFSLDHIALSVKDVNVSIAFYQSVLRLGEIENTASDSPTRWLSLGNSQQLHLIPRPDFEVRVNKAVHFALTALDMDAFVAHLVALKVDYTDWLDTPNRDYIRKDGIKQVYFQDPDGYWIEVNDAASDRGRI